jgi:AraC family transcriptional regulator
MHTRTLHDGASLRVIDYRCTAGPNDAPFVEVHELSSLSFVRAGSFGCHVGTAHHELVPGSTLLGRSGDEYVCTHDHHAGGDECLSIQLSPTLAAELQHGMRPLITGSVPPIAELMIAAELAQASAAGASTLSIEETSLLFLMRYAAVVRGKSAAPLKVHAKAGRQMIDAAHWIEAHAEEPISLEDVAAYAQQSPFHFLRLFSKVIGATPHQYLVRTRLRRAARLLASDERRVTEVAYAVGFGDLSNFVRTFARAAGASPRAFRQATRGERKILQDRLEAEP